MKRQSPIFLLLGLFLVLGALYLIMRDDDSRSSAESRALLQLPNSGSVEKIVITEGEISTELRVVDDRWTLPSRDNYPAASDKVRALLLKLLNLQVNQKVSEKQDAFTHFGVDDAAVKGGRTRVSLQDASGKEIIGVYLGELRRTRSLDPMNSAAGQYVRRAGENVVYLVPETIAFSSDPVLWIRSELLAIAEDHVWKITQEKLPEHVLDFELLASDPGTPKKYNTPDRIEVEASTASQIGTGLENFRIEDVVRRDSDAGKALTFDRSTTYDLDTGQRITVDTAVTTTGDKSFTFARLQATFDPKLLEEIKARYAQVNESRRGTEQGDHPLETPKAATEEETAKLNASFADWYYRVPDFQAEKYRKTKDDLAKKSS